MNFLVNRIWYTARASLHRMPVVRVAAPPSPRRIAGIALPYRRRHYCRTGKAIKLQKLIYH